MRYRYSSNARQAQHDYIARRAREKLYGPVGEKQLTVPLEICLTTGGLDKPICKHCGYHVCSCKHVVPATEDRRVIRGTRFMHKGLIWAVRDLDPKMFNNLDLRGRIGGIRITEGSSSGRIRSFDLEYVLQNKIAPARIRAESITVWDLKTKQNVLWPNPDPQFSEGIFSPEMFWERYRPRCKISTEAVYECVDVYGPPIDPCIV